MRYLPPPATIPDLANLQNERRAQNEHMPTSRTWQKQENLTRKSSRVSRPVHARLVAKTVRARATGCRQLPNSSCTAGNTVGNGGTLSTLLRTEIGNPPDEYGEYVQGSTDKDPTFGMYYGNYPSAAEGSWGDRVIEGVRTVQEGEFGETLWEIIGVHDRKPESYGKTIWNRFESLLSMAYKLQVTDNTL